LRSKKHLSDPLSVIVGYTAIWLVPYSSLLRYLFSSSLFEVISSQYASNYNIRTLTDRNYQIAWAFVVLIWGTVKLDSVLRDYRIDTNSSSWMFGRLVPVVLLASPILLMVWKFAKYKLDHTSDHDSQAVLIGEQTAMDGCKSTTELFDRTYYVTTPWIWPGISSAYFSATVLVLVTTLFTDSRFG
jgi:hypothetical protein